MHFVPRELEQRAQSLPRILIVLDDQQPTRSLRPLVHRLRACGAAGLHDRRRLFEWQPHDESTTATGTAALRLDAAAVKHRQPPHEREPDAESARVAVQSLFALCERIEHARQEVRMYAGAIVEKGGVVPVMTRPLMPYTQGLLHSVPRLDPESLGRDPLEAIPGSVPDPFSMPQGCAFAPRCRHAEPKCESVAPVLETADDDHDVRCRRWRKIAEAGA